MTSFEISFMTKETGKANSSIVSRFGKHLNIRALACSSDELVPLNFSVDALTLVFLLGFTVEPRLYDH